MSFRDTILAFIIILIWGFNFVVIAWGLESLPPFLLGTCRFVLIAVFGSFFVRHPGIPFRWLFLYGISLGFSQFAFLFAAMSFGMPAGLASLVLQAQMLFTIFFASFLLKETIKPVQFIAIIIAGCGLSLIGSTNSSGAMTAIGFGLTLAGASCWAIGNIVNKVISQKGYKADVGLVVWSAWIPPLPFIILSYIFEGPEVIVRSFHMSNWLTIGSLFYLAFIASILGYGLWGYLFSRYPASKVAPLTLGVPVVGLTSAALFLDETISLLQSYGILLVLLGLGVIIWGDKLFKKFHHDTNG